MEKISGIVPSSARVTSVDLQSTGAARPGMPSFGRPQGISSLTERRTALDTAAKATFEHQDLMAGRTPNVPTANPMAAGGADAASNTVKDLSDKFFATRLNSREKAIELPSTVSSAPHVEDLTHIQESREFFVQEGTDPGAAVSAKLVPRGTYVDVRA